MLLAIEIGVAAIVFLLAIVMLQLGSLKPCNLLVGIGLGIIFLASLATCGIIGLDVTSRIAVNLTASSNF